MDSLLPEKTHGETDLATLLKGLSPVVIATDFWYCLVTEAQLKMLSLDDIYGLFREAEGITVILNEPATGPAGLTEKVSKMEGPFAAITCQVHSSLAAVGLTATIAKALTQHDISANVVAGFYHDHIFVATEHADKACRVMQQLGLQS